MNAVRRGVYPWPLPRSYRGIAAPLRPASRPVCRQTRPYGVTGVGSAGSDGVTFGVGFAVGLGVGFGVGLGVGLGVAAGRQLLTPLP